MQLAIQQRTQAHVEALAQDFRSNPSPHGLHFFRYELDHYALMYEKTDFPEAKKQMMAYAQILSKLSGRKIIVETMKNLAEYILAFNVMTKKTTFSDKSAIYVVLGDGIVVDEGIEGCTPDYIKAVKDLCRMLPIQVTKAIDSIGSLVLGTTLSGGSYRIHSLSGLYFASKQCYGMGNKGEGYYPYSLEGDGPSGPMDFSPAMDVPAVMQSDESDANGVQAIMESLRVAYHSTQAVVGVWASRRTVANVIPASFALGSLSRLVSTIQHLSVTDEQRMLLDGVVDYINETNEKIERRYKATGKQA